VSRSRPSPAYSQATISAVKQLEAGGLGIGHDIRARLSPLVFEHINFHGFYPFHLEVAVRPSRRQGHGLAMIDGVRPPSPTRGASPPQHWSPGSTTPQAADGVLDFEHPDDGLCKYHLDDGLCKYHLDAVPAAV
jgi:hypothetical protein